MTNFKKLKKTLAVSLCSTMLFSGQPKTSGMNVGEATKIVAAYFTEKTFGKISNLIKGKRIAKKTDEVVIELKKAYNKTCLILNHCNNNHNQNINQQNSILNLIFAKNLIEHAEKKRITGGGWVNPFDYRSINDYPDDVQKREKKIIQKLAEALSGILGVYNNDFQLNGFINNARNTEYPINEMKLVFDRILELELALNHNDLNLNNVIANPLTNPNGVFV